MKYKKKRKNIIVMINLNLNNNNKFLSAFNKKNNKQTIINKSLSQNKSNQNKSNNNYNKANNRFNSHNYYNPDKIPLKNMSKARFYQKI